MFQFEGLTSAQVEASREAHGSNQITPQEAESFLDKLMGNFKDPMIIILLVALGIVTVLAVLGHAEWYEGVAIAAAVALATLVSTASEFKNEQTFQKLQEEASRIFIHVFRDGGLTQVAIDNIVKGDVVLLQPGDKVPADGVMLQGRVRVNQAALTGEPEAVTKLPGEGDVSRLDDPHAVFRGAIVEDGEGVMVVDVVGDQTQLGQLAGDLDAEERLGPLRLKLGDLADNIARFGYIASVFIALAFMFKVIYLDTGGDMAAMGAYFANWQGVLHDVVTALILAVIIIVVAVPEGLPMMIAIVLAQNMRKLLKSNVLVRQLLGVETSGSLNLLFTDKTGTITFGKLNAVGFLAPDGQKDDPRMKQYSGFEEIPAPLARFLDLSLRENTSCVVNCNAPKESDRILGGNSTEKALLRFIGADTAACMEKGAELVSQVLFSSERKFSSARVRLQNGEDVTLVKGAPERILERCDRFYLESGVTRLLSSSMRERAVSETEVLADEGFRLVAMAIAVGDVPETFDAPPENLILVGFGLIRDELRPESRPAIQELKDAGIHVVMCTGDRTGTARAIARDVGLVDSEDDVVISSEELAGLSDAALSEIMPRLKVVSRCLPRDKVRLVKVAQDMGLVVGMTGDGVNDSPALKNADIGFALGSGTEVAKEAAAIVVLDDNIQSIADAVHYGRTIYRSIQKFITFQLTVNVSAIAIAFLGPFLGFKLPLTMIQLLWVNLVMDTLAALAFSGEPPLKQYMQEKPKRRDEKLITSGMWFSILGNGLFATLLSVVLLKSQYLQGLFHNEAAFLTGFFAIFIFIHNFNKFNVRVEDFNLFGHIFKNSWFLRVVGIIFVVQVLITYFGGEIFRTTFLTPMEWVWVIAISILIIPFDLLRKVVWGAVGNR